MRSQVAQDAATRLLARGMVGLPPAAGPRAVAPEPPGPSVGLERGVVCGCHAPKCGTCMETGGCGWSGCGWCSEFGYLQGIDRRGVRASKRRDIGWGSQDDGGPQGGLGPPPSVSTVGLGSFLGGPERDFYDVHSHNFQADDWTTHRTVTDIRIERLRNLRWFGVQKIALSGMVTNPASTAYTSATLNDLTAYARDTDPDFFVPICQVIVREMTTAAGLDEARTRLRDTGFRGVGELFVHGHGENTFTDSPGYDHLLGIFQAAKAAGVPVQVHWDVGNIETSGNPRTVAGNRAQLWALLDELGGSGSLVARPDAATQRMKLILAHCGAGPATQGGGDDPSDFLPWALFITLLLARDDVDVYLDISGMQKGDPGLDTSVRRLFVREAGTDDLTELGALVLTLMDVFPTRFLVGLDADNQYQEDTVDSSGQFVWGMDSYAESAQLYRDFLELGALDDDTKKLILSANAEALFEPTTPATPTLFDGPRFFGDPHVSWIPGGRLDERFFFDPAWLASHFDLTGAGAWRLRW